MKTLQQIIERDDYKRLSRNLANKVEDLANIVIKKMEELEIEELGDLSLVTKSASYYTHKYLVIKKDYYYQSGVLNVCRNSDYGGGRPGFYYAGDYSKWVDFATNEEALYFLNNFKKYMELLDEIESKKVAEIENYM